ncbi:MAG: group II intron maturase-specific domain-containing protein [Candidatus Binataceae bacterium]
MSQPSNRDEPVTSTKPFEISKHAVLAANRRVKANRGAAGVSGLGFTFKSRASRNRQGRILKGFLPAASRVAIIRMLPAVKSWQPQRLTLATIEQVSARYKKVQSGWWNYYGNFYPSVMERISFQVDRKLARWTRVV